jgi:hypothetical protein
MEFISQSVMYGQLKEVISSLVTEGLRMGHGYCVHKKLMMHAANYCSYIVQYLLCCSVTVIVCLFVILLTVSTNQDTQQ